jgi:EAL and modified HD-GYP domain-containing signal transduction protein
VSDPSILGQIALGYSPFIDRNRAVTATRLTVFPLRPDAVLDVAQLLHEVGNVWPASGGRVSLNVISESLLQDLLNSQPSANLMVEVPAFMAADALATAVEQALSRVDQRVVQGTRLPAKHFGGLGGRDSLRLAKQSG